GPLIVVLHGGPAAAGEAAPIARGLAASFLVLEPWQRGSGEEPLTVARHVADLHELVKTRCGSELPAIVGHSWGAMLALAYAAAHPGYAGPLVLVGCGTFDKRARARLHDTIEERMADDLRGRLSLLDEEVPDPGERLRRRHELIRALYLYDPIDASDEGDALPAFDPRAHEETWSDMLRLQGEGVYPAAFAAIDSPVLMLHGAFDPHPGSLIRAGLEPYLGRLEYREWARCGHYPWLEKAVRDEFFAVLRAWLAERLHPRD
ncbi:MAG: alpha/beta hydrolase, partial [Candidatus Eisenbacteria bacterium]